MSLALYAAGIGLAFVSPWIAYACYVALAVTWFVPDRRFSADSLHYPTSVAEVQQLVAHQPRVKALGTRHSFNTIADCPGGALISLSELAPDITVDAQAMTVSVTGGTRYGVLVTELQSQGYALHNTGSLPHISVAGATATGTHGSGDRNGILSTAVAAVDLVKAGRLTGHGGPLQPRPEGAGGWTRGLRRDHPVGARHSADLSGSPGRLPATPRGTRCWRRSMR